jgi:hypothetical protein
MGWSDNFVETLKNNDVRFVTYVPDNVLTPLTKGVTSVLVRSRFMKAVGTGRGGALEA